MNKPLTPETEAYFKLSIDNFLHDVYPFLSFINNQINEIKKRIVNNNSQIKEKFQIEKSKKLRNEKKLTEYIMFLDILMLDMSVIMNLFLNGKSDYEKLFALKQGNVIINEGYKTIFSFVKLEDDGTLNYSERNKSFWYKDIRLTVKDSPKLNLKFKKITNELEDYYTTSFDSVNKIRNLTVHYDKNPIKFYQMITSLETETIFVKLKDFAKIIDEMNSFVFSILEEKKY